MHFDWWTFALQTANFAVLVWLLHRFLYKPVLRMIDARRAEVEKQYADASAVEEKARAALADIETQRAANAAERTAALNAAASQAKEAAAATHASAMREANALMEESRKALAAEREAAISEARRAALGLGVDIARRLLAEVPTDLRTRAWLERVEQHITSMTPAERNQLAQGLNGGGTLHVVTAVPLPDPVTAEWRVRLGRALGDRTPIEFESDAALVAGVELNFPNAILRFSWRSALAVLRAEIEGHDDAD